MAKNDKTMFFVPTKRFYISKFVFCAAIQIRFTDKSVVIVKIDDWKQ